MNNFNNNNNKAILWNIMSEEGIFSNINMSNVKEIFEQQINIIDKTYNKTKNITEKNKLFMKSVVIQLNKIRNSNNNNSNNNNNNELRKYDVPITAQDIKNKRTQHFGENLEKRQREFSKLLSIETPKKVDFSDDVVDKPIGEEINKILEETMKAREMQIQTAFQNNNIEKAEKWVGVKNSKNNESMPVKLKIGEKIIINNKPKRVRFNVDDKDDKNKQTSDEKTIFKLFKKKERSIKDIIFDMKKIRADMSNKLKMINNLIIELETK